jgi:hypothetical protein
MHRDDVPVQEPCFVAESELDARQLGHFCRTCRKHVHDLSAMSESAATVLLKLKGERDLCVSYRTDLDGRLLHQPAPARRPFSRAASVLGASALVAGCATSLERLDTASFGNGSTDELAAELEPRCESADLPLGSAAADMPSTPRRGAPCAVTSTPAPPTVHEERLVPQAPTYLVRGRYAPTPIDRNPRVPKEGELPRPAPNEKPPAKKESFDSRTERG